MEDLGAAKNPFTSGTQGSGVTALDTPHVVMGYQKPQDNPVETTPTPQPQGQSPSQAPANRSPQADPSQGPGPVAEASLGIGDVPQAAKIQQDYSENYKKYKDVLGKEPRDPNLLTQPAYVEHKTNWKNFAIFTGLMLGVSAAMGKGSSANAIAAITGMGEGMKAYMAGDKQKGDQARADFVNKSLQVIRENRDRLSAFKNAHDQWAGDAAKAQNEMYASALKHDLPALADAVRTKGAIGALQDWNGYWQMTEDTALKFIPALQMMEKLRVQAEAKQGGTERDRAVRRLNDYTVYKDHNQPTTPEQDRQAYADASLLQKPYSIVHADGTKEERPGTDLKAGGFWVPPDFRQAKTSVKPVTDAQAAAIPLLKQDLKWMKQAVVEFLGPDGGKDPSALNKLLGRYDWTSKEARNAFAHFESAYAYAKRVSTGATATPDEIADFKKAYFPLPTDSPEVARDKIMAGFERIRDQIKIQQLNPAMKKAYDAIGGMDLNLPWEEKKGKAGSKALPLISDFSEWKGLKIGAEYVDAKGKPHTRKFDPKYDKKQDW